MNLYKTANAVTLEGSLLFLMVVEQASINANYFVIISERSSRGVKGIGYPKSANFSIILFYAQNEDVCV